MSFKFLFGLSKRYRELSKCRNNLQQHLKIGYLNRYLTYRQVN